MNPAAPAGVASPAQSASPQDGGTRPLAGLLDTRRTGSAARSTTHVLALSPDAAQRIAEGARRLKCLPDTPFVAAWMLLLARWGGQSTAVCAEVSNRVVAVTVGIDLAMTGAALVSAVDAARRLAREDAASAQQALASCEWAWLGDAATATVPADIALALRISSAANPSVPAALHGVLAAEVDAGLAQTLLARIADVAAALCAAEGASLAEFDTLGADQRALLLQALNPPIEAIDPAATVHGVFARIAAQRPEASALSFNGAVTTYRELAERSSTMAAQLRALGVEPGHAVAMALERSPDAIVAALAILKAGACYLPVDASHPPGRLAFMLQDAGVKLVLCTQDNAGAFNEAAGVRLLAVDGTALAGEPIAASDSLPTVGAADLAYVMYTSGSTGTPKGVLISHDSILRLVIDAHYVRLGADTRVLHAAPLAFDASTLEIWGPLLNGGCCVLHPEHMPTPAGLEAVIRAERVDTAWLTAALFNAIVDDDPLHLRGLRQLLIGGEALSVPHVRRLLAALPDVALINGYGPTECTTFAATWHIPHDLPADAHSVPIGRPINATHAFILGPGLELLPRGCVGKLYVGGRGLARGYLNRPELTAERFVPSPFAAGERLYDTGDLARLLPDGAIDFLGRSDQQVKIRGFRIELGEIEARMSAHASVQACTVGALADAAGNTALVAWLVAAAGAAVPDTSALRAHLARDLPEFMVPSSFLWMERLPITANGKLDRAALPRPADDRPDLATPYKAPVGEREQQLCEAIAAVLGIARVGADDNFFELGGNSLQVLKLLARLKHAGVEGLHVAAFFRHPTAAAMAARLDDAATPAPARAAAAQTAAAHSADARPDDDAIAIIAMAGRFPGARDVEQFWANLVAGRDTVTHFGDGDLDPSLAASLVADPDYVRARGVIDDVEMFDPAFFGISPREAELMDPQQRIFMELCWEALERGGHVPDAGEMPIGVFGGMYNATYYKHHLQSRPDLVDKIGEFAVMLANEKDYVATRTANRLNLTGPAISVHTACSTSLVAIAQAFWSLRQGDCRMALAGGASITCPPRSGYLYQAGAMLSPDGHTRTFDVNSGGTVFSDGAAVVLLKRLADALEDGNEVIAVIRGVAVNNDGRNKASFTAPGIDGQAAVVERAQRVAGVSARSISYVEAHGTATPIGDPVEIEALTQAFRHSTDEAHFCRIGSLKSNVGHMVIAAGAASVIKTALSLRHEQLPASIHYTAPNPAIAFDGSPFVVNDRLQAWPRGDVPRRAGVSSFGVGGTNAHAVLEEAPARAPSTPARGAQRLQLAARSAAALEAMAARLADHLEAHPEANLADVAFTLEHGRSRFVHRTAVVAAASADAVAALRARGHASRVAGVVGARTPALVWLFPGQGAQYADMGRALAEADPAFAQAFDAALDAVAPAMSFDLRARLRNESPDALRATEATQPALFCIEYALGRAWQARGLVPSALVGHSVGEFAAAALAGVMSLADAARLVARRGALLQAQPPGSMLSVRASLADVQALVPEGIHLAAENGPRACVFAGPSDAIAAWAAALEQAGMAARALVTSHAFHSPAMDAAVEPFEVLVRTVTLSAPRIPIVSTATGDWLTDAQATDPKYWATQLRAPVLFSRALRAALAAHAGAVLMEMGPRESLCTLVRQHATPGSPAPSVIASLGDAPASEAARMMLADAHLWTLGIDTTTPCATPAGDRRRVALPTYPFERKRFWVDASAPATAAAVAPAPAPSPVTVVATVVIDPPSIATSPLPRSTMSASAPVSRHPALIARLRDLFGDIAGLDLSTADPATAFVEFGIDSLTLTQVAMQTKKRFGVGVTFRQMSETCRTFDTLATFLDGAMPPDAAAPAPAPAPLAAPVAAAAAPVAAWPAVAPGVASAEGGLVQQVIAQQMALMAQQLALLGGQPAMAAVAPALAAATPAVATPTPVAAAPAAAPEQAATGASGVIQYDVKKAFGAIARIHTQAGEITARQRARLETFMRRYVERTAKSKAYTTKHRDRLADPRVVNGFRPSTKEVTYQILIEKSQGSRLWDIDGNEYVDVLNGFGMNMFGWQPPFVQEAVRRQLEAGYEIGPQHPLAGEVADLICQMTGNDRVGLCNTGSEAVMAAVRIARTVTCRNTVVLFTGSYHGTFDEVLVRAGRNAKGIPAAPGIMADVFDDVRVLDYGTPEAIEYIRAHADDLAAVLIEPVQSRRPDFQPREFLRQVREITEASGTCLIFDEVITGFRLHPGGVQAMFGIHADLTTYGKVIGGGFPIGVVAGKRHFMDALDGGPWQYGDDSVPSVGVTYFAGTFVRHPLALAAAKASLEHLRDQGGQLQEQLNLSTAAMADELSAFCREVGAPIEIRHFGSLWRVSWQEDHPLQDLLFAMMRSRGIHILDNFPCFMTTAHTPLDIARIKSAFKESVAELQQAEFLPARAVAAEQPLDLTHPPVPGARLGRNANGEARWYVPNPDEPGKYMVAVARE
jgi:amino acid adenylation domain-containing protein